MANEQIEILKQFNSDSKWVSDNFNKLHAEYSGNYVAINKAKVIAKGKDIKDIVSKAEKLGVKVENIVVQFIPEEKFLAFL